MIGWVIVLLVLSIFCFIGVASYAVWSGVQDRKALSQTDKQICGAVVGLRRDFVQVIKEQRGRAIKNVKKLGLDVEQTKKDYQDLIDKIGDEACP